MSEVYTIVDHLKTVEDIPAILEDYRKEIPYKVLCQISSKGYEYDLTPQDKWTLVKYYVQARPEIISKSKKRELVMKRQYLMVYLRKKTNFSLVKIGNLMGNRDHATVVHAQKSHRNYEDTKDDMYQQETELLRVLFKI